ncbi:MAG: T4 RnlA family RNA ligase [Patescibacteria group bacterium]|nr:T4 RnlA family RNA ligase [Patescibacteria group bacterium]
MQPEISEFIFKELESGKSVEEIHSYLSENYGILAVQSTRHPYLYQYNYTEMNKTKFDPLVLSSRGTILDVKNRIVVAYPFRRFFNYNEWPEDPFSFDNINSVQEKLDGSLIIFYWYDGWNVATRGNPDALGKVNSYDFTFNDLFWKTLERQYPNWSVFSSPRFVYMFELCSKYNQNITDQSDNEGELTLIGVRCRNGWGEFHVKDFMLSGWKVVNHYELSTKEEILEACKNLNPRKHEGFVLVDDYNNKLKIKNPMYLLAHQYFSQGGLTAKNALHLYKSKERDEFFFYFPEFKEKYEKYMKAYNSIADRAESYWNNPEFQNMISSKAPKRELVCWINENVDEKFRFIILEMLKGKSAKDVVENTLEKKLIMFMEEFVDG